jgi:multidrug resistance efflux pump
MEFRVKALARMRAPDEIDTPTTLASPRGWIAVLVVAIIIAGGAVWAFAGSLPITVGASGLLSHPQGISMLQSPVSGMVSDITVAPGAKVSAGQTVAEIRSGQQQQPVVSPFGGLVVGVAATTGQIVGAGSTVLTVERTDGTDGRMVALLFVSASAAAELAPGMKADIAVSSAPSAAFGLLKGQVAAVSQYPLDPASLSNLLGGDSSLSGYTSSGAPWLVTVDLTPQAGSPSGFAWTSAEGPPESLHSLTSVTATLSLGSQTPASFVLGD